MNGKWHSLNGSYAVYDNNIERSDKVQSSFIWQLDLKQFWCQIANYNY